MTTPGGRIEALFTLDPGAEIVSTPVPSLPLAFGGILGDRHHGLLIPAPARQKAPPGTMVLNRRQLSLVSVEELADVALAMGIPVIEPAWIGSNLVVSGVPQLSDVPGNATLVFESGATLTVSEKNIPCLKAGTEIAGRYGDPPLATAWVKAAMTRRGLLAMVVREGQVKVGDAFRLEAPIGR